MQVWQDIGPSFQDPATEVRVSYRAPGIEITGHIDVLSRYPRRAILLDWKSGYLDKIFFLQLAAYATCLILGEGYQEVVAMVGWLRDQEKETYTFTRATVLAWVDRLRTQQQRRGRYTIGSPCANCPRNHSCPALLADARRAVAVFGSEPYTPERIAATLQELPEPERVRLFRQVKSALTLGKAAKDALRLNVIQN